MDSRKKLTESQREESNHAEPTNNLNGNGYGRRLTDPGNIGKPFLIVLIFIAIGIGGLYYRKSNLEKPTFFQNSQETAAKTSSPTEINHITETERLFKEQKNLIEKKDEIITEKEHKINELEGAISALTGQVAKIQSELETLKKKPGESSEKLSKQEILKHLTEIQSRLRLLVRFEKNLDRGKPFQNDLKALKPYLSESEIEKISKFDSFSQTGLLTPLKMSQKLEQVQSMQKIHATMPADTSDAKSVWDHLKSLVIIERTDVVHNPSEKNKIFLNIDSDLKSGNYEKALELLKSTDGLKDEPLLTDVTHNLEARIALEALIEELITNPNSLSVQETSTFTDNGTKGD